MHKLVLLASPEFTSTNVKPNILAAIKVCIWSWWRRMAASDGEEGSSYINTFNVNIQGHDWRIIWDQWKL